jgi:HTH-type transcriptional regulator/antitoxin HigA
MVENKGQTVMLKKADMRDKNLHPIETTVLNELFKQMSQALENFAPILVKLTRYTQYPIETEDEVLERAKVMDELMDMAKTEDDIVMFFANAISDRIEEFENEQLDLPKMKLSDVLANLMMMHCVKQKDLFEVAPPNVISELLNEKRAMTVEQIKGFSKFFGVPVTMFID